MCGHQIGGGLGNGWKRWKRLRSTNCRLLNSHEDIKYSKENIVSNSVITVWCQMGIRLIRMIT